MQSGGDTDLPTILFQKRPIITVDESGGLFTINGLALELKLWLVGTIGGQTNPARETLQSGHMSDDQGSDVLTPTGYTVPYTQTPPPVVAQEGSFDLSRGEIGTSGTFSGRGASI